MQPAKPARLVQGVDYYLEGGKFVFTAEYHLKRGHCCNSKCRHCPYGVDGGLTARIEIVGLPSKGAAAPSPRAPTSDGTPGVSPVTGAPRVSEGDPTRQ